MAEVAKHRVVIVGGGFGGLFAAKVLRRAPVRVTVKTATVTGFDQVSRTVTAGRPDHEPGAGEGR